MGIPLEVEGVIGPGQGHLEVAQGIVDRPELWQLDDATLPPPVTWRS